MPIAAVAAFLLLLAAAADAANPNPRTPHTELHTHGFPTGLLPTAAAAYTLNDTTGDFAVTVSGGDCHVTLPPDNYLAVYGSVISGRLFEGRIEDLEGIRVRAFFRWWGIDGIRVVGEDLEFRVGGVKVKYPVKNFEVGLVCEGRKADS